MKSKMVQLIEIAKRKVKGKCQKVRFYREMEKDDRGAIISSLMIIGGAAISAPFVMSYLVWPCLVRLFFTLTMVVYS